MSRDHASARVRRIVSTTLGVGGATALLAAAAAAFAEREAGRAPGRERASARTAAASVQPDASLAAAPVARTIRTPLPVPSGRATAIDVSPRPYGRPVASSFLGTSIEYPALQAYAGSDPASPNTLFLRLTRYLAPHQIKDLRIGGRSGDRAWVPLEGVTPSPGIDFEINSGWLDSARALAANIGGRFTFVLNLEANDPQIPVAEANALLNAVGPAQVGAFEIGNEPNWYTKFAYYRTADGQRVLGRPQGYGLRDYVAQFRQVAALLPTVTLAGPAVGSNRWLGGLGRFIAADSRVGLVTVHRYPLNRCLTPLGSTYSATVPHLLSSIASRGLAGTVAGPARATHAHGLRFRVDELNSVACGGQRGVSDTFASAMWALDTLYALAAAGVDGVDIHTFPGAAYEPYAFNQKGGRWRARVRPMYYGLLAFAEAAPAGSRLLGVRVRARGDSLRAWADRAPDGSPRVVLLNTDPHRPRAVAVAVPGARGPLAVRPLTAPGLASRTGVSLGGQSFASPTATARLEGPERLGLVPPTAGRYRLRLAPGSAAILEPA